jgi:hypothetical protein
MWVDHGPARQRCVRVCAAIVAAVRVSRPQIACLPQRPSHDQAGNPHNSPQDQNAFRRGRARFGLLWLLRSLDAGYPALKLRDHGNAPRRRSVL